MVNSSLGGRLPTGPGCVVGVGDLGLATLDALLAGVVQPEIRGLFKTEFDRIPVASRFRGVSVLGPLSVLPRYAGELRWAIVAVDSAFERETIAAAMRAANIPLAAAVHPDATVSGGATICPGAIVGARAIVGVGARVGRSAVCGIGCVVDSYATVGDYAEVGAGAVLGRRVRIGERTEIGAGALIREETLIGPEARVHLGAVVSRDVRAGECFGFDSRRESPWPKFDGVR